jgi:hypothetical protein
LSGQKEIIKGVLFTFNLRRKFTTTCGEKGEQFNKDLLFIYEEVK